MNPDNVFHLCITAAAGTELAVAYFTYTVKLRDYLPRSLHLGLKKFTIRGPYPSRGVAPSGFRPLRNIPNCCLP